MTEQNIPRIVISGTGSGCGKTTVVCALLQAFTDMSLHVGAFKCGPDYIDPMFHRTIIGTDSFNLDSFFFDGDTLNYLLAKNGAGRELNLIEGVMGYYDGAGFDSFRASTCEVSQITQSPTVLVVNARGAAASVLAVIHGFRSFSPDNRICGVILNQCTEMTYRMLAEQIRRRFEGIRPLGYLPVMKDCSLESRHLGLVTADEVKDLKEKLHKLAEQAKVSLDLDGIRLTAQQAKSLSFQKPQLPDPDEPVRIAVAKDRAFCFYYEDSLELLREMGAQLIFFSPLEDKVLPAQIHGLYLGGGYPELYAKQLADNRFMKESIREALADETPCIAECGGFLYLTEALNMENGDSFPMAGVILGSSCNTGSLRRFGYVTLTACADNLLCRKGNSIRGHEFHYWDSENPGDGFLAEKPSGKTWNCVHASAHLYAGYPHFHFYSNPAFAENFYRACLAFKRK